MRVLVTGATGFIGANLVRLLLERGQTVRVVRRAGSPGLVLEGLPVETVTGSLTDPAVVEAAVKGCEQVYHLAGVYDTAPGGEARMEAIHVKATALLGETALRLGVSRMVVCSSSITLPFGPLEAPAGEEDADLFAAAGVPYRAALLAYYRTKKAQDGVARGLVAQGLETVLVHPDFVLGPWDVKPTSSGVVLQVAKAPWLPFCPSGGKSFIRAEDCALGHVLAMERGQPGASYLLGDHNLTYREALSRIAKVVGRPTPGPALPQGLLGVLPLIARVSGGRIPAVGELSTRLESLFIGRYRDPSRARRELGLPSSPFEQGVEEAWRWFVDHGYAGKKRR